MLEKQESLIPTLNPSDPLGRSRKLRALTIGFEKESIDEMQRLLETLDIECDDFIVVPVRNINPATYIGSGKLEEIKSKCEASEKPIDAIIIDIDLSPNQLRNIEKIFNKPILDRAGVIIEIFSAHARTKEAKTQVALARVQYLLPRLTHFWSHFERQRGGGVGNRGMGEKQLEVDRRILKQKIKMLKERLVAIQKERAVQRASRNAVNKVALVGYTNAGKSTLLNALTQSRVLAEDKLFATLDSSVRALDPDSHPPVVAIDTVGFISKIPTTLVASFRSTLEEIHEADLILHIVDASSSQAIEQMKVTEEVLEELGLKDKPKIMVLNKCDLISGDAEKNRVRILAPGAIQVSALKPDSVRLLKEKVLKYFIDQMETYEVMIPYSESKLEAMIQKYGAIETKNYLDKGTFYRLKMDQRWAGMLNLLQFKT